MRPGPIFISATLCLPLLTGCSLQQTASPKPEPAVKLNGSVHGGQQPIAGAHVYLFAANNTGYGQPSVSLLNAASTGASDSLGAYVLTDGNGGFTITGDYACTPNTQVYLYTHGGNPGAGVNSAAALLAALGNCPASGSFLASIPFIQVNEVTTIAAAYAMSGFATDATHVSSSGTPLALIGIANAFANASNLADISTGNALATTPAGNGTVPFAEINTLGNILAACVNSTGPGSAPCSTLFSNTLSSGTSGTTPTDTATAAINIAHHPGVNVQTLVGLSTPTSPFQPTPFRAPNDFTVGISFADPTLNSASLPQSIAIDGSGNVWSFNSSSSSNWVAKLSPLGSVLSGANGYPVGSDVAFPAGKRLAIDQNGNAWLTGSTYIYRISSSGTVSAFQPDEGSAYYDIAIDGSGNVWTNSTSGTPSLVELSPSGTDLHFTSTSPIGNRALAIDGSGIVWTSGGPAPSLFGTSIATGTSVNVTGNNPGSGGLAIDSGGDIWAMNSSLLPVLTLFAYNSSTNTCSPISASGNDTRPSGLTIDGSNTVWLASTYNPPSVDAYSNSGNEINPIGSYMYNPNGAYNTYPWGIATDPSGDVWITTGGPVVEFIGASTPVVTPLSVGVKNHTIATRP
ncbi:MAG TPA: hypothetical protein VK684_14060 [Edaphobacter sp.]|nr:hypothetical protein [Edaphobacter sp.]